MSSRSDPRGTTQAQQLTAAPDGTSREKKSRVFSGGKSKQQKVRPAEATNTELAKLLSNRTRALLAFEDASFNPDSFLQTYMGQLSEKAIDNARQDLGALLATCTEEVESVVQQHHQRFLQACGGVEALEDQVALLRNYTNGLTALVASLKTALNVKPTAAAAAAAGGAKVAAGGWRSHQQAPLSAAHSALPGAAPGITNSSIVPEIESDMELLLQELDLAAAGRDLPAAVQWLRVAEAAGQLLDRDASQLVLEVEDFPGWRHSFDAAVGLRRQQLVAALQRQLSDANASAAEIRAATRALADLIGQATALQAMLQCYSHKIQMSQALLLKQLTSGADPDSIDFAGGLSQRTFLDIAAAADDLVATFGVGQRESASLFSVWAEKETRSLAAMLRRHVLTPAAAASTGLHTTVQAVAMTQVLAAMLELSHSVSLTATLTSELWPPVDGAIRRHLKRFTDELRMAASEEMNTLVVKTMAAAAAAQEEDEPPAGGSGRPGPPVQIRSLLTGNSLCREVSMLAELLTPIANSKLAATFRKALTEMFTAATQSITLTLKSHMEASTGNAAILAPLVPAVMEVLAGIIEEGLSDAVAAFSAQSGPVIDVKSMDMALNTMYKDCQASIRAAKAVAGAKLAAAKSADGGRNE